MRKVLAVSAALAAFAVPTATAVASSGWHVASQSASEAAYAATATNVAVSRPHQIAVYLSHGGFAAWSCSRGSSVRMWRRTYGAGVHTLAHVRGQDVCDVAASVTGSGRVRVQILTHR